MTDFYARWVRFYAAHPEVRCETCGFEVRFQTHFFTNEDQSGGFDGLSCDYLTGSVARPLGSRRKSIFKGFNDTMTATPARYSTECKCDMRDLISPCGHSKDCGYMLNKRKVA